MKSNIATIIGKECKRFFGDRALFFTAVIMPGLLIYLIYTMIGNYMPEIESNMDVVNVEVQDNLTPEERILFDSLSAKAYTVVSTDENGEEVSEQEEFGKVLSGLIPMLIITLLFSGCMSVAPASIAGDKERGTIATLLVTPLRRSELAIGKIVSLSCFALLSGFSSFLGIILSLPKMLHVDELGIEGSLYGTKDYLLLLLIIFSTVLVIVSLISILSALAKSVKNATTMVTPLMIIAMLAGLSPMILGSKDLALATYFIPIFNSVQSMSSVFAYQIEVVPLLVTIATNILFSLCAVWVLTRLFNSEKVMFSK